MEVHSRAFEAGVLLEALLEVLHLVSHGPHKLPQFLAFTLVLEQEPVCVDHFLNLSLIHDFDSEPSFERESVELHAEHLGQSLKPVHLHCSGVFSLTN